jgi:sulfatase modifying factor 1
MKVRTLIPFVAVLVGALTFAARSPGQLITMETVLVGDIGNAPDRHTYGFGEVEYGSVEYEYRIGKYEVTIGQYTAFLNVVANSDPYSLYAPEGPPWSPGMPIDANIAGINRSGSSGSYTYSVAEPYGSSPAGANSPNNRPIAYVNWFDAARFANWMHNGATNGASTETGAYTLNGATSGIFTKNPGAIWWIPSEDEWYKAAYYKGGGTNAGYWVYPTQSDTAPGNEIGNAANQANYNAGDFAVTQSADYSDSQNYLTDVGAFSNSASAYGTFDQAGNLWEWNDAISGGTARGLRGSHWESSGITQMQSSVGGIGTPGFEDNTIGFRLATVPEPSTYALIAMSAAGALWWARRRR